MYDPTGEKTGKIPEWKKSSDLQREEAALKKIADKNFESKITKEKKLRSDLIDNFHWVIMRVRRSKKLTQEQFAKEISEPLAAVKLAEEGILPDKDYILAKKIENFLGITIIKKETISAQPKIEVKSESNAPADKLVFDPHAAKRLTIADIRRMRETKEPESYSEFEVDFEEQPEENKKQ